MPPKKLKDLSSAPVYTMPHGQQVRLLSDALLREYMHRRGYLATLKAFDDENPRDGETVSSRALMSDLMALEQQDQQRLKVEGIETIMEMLCDLRVEKRLEVEAFHNDNSSEAASSVADASAPSEVALEALKARVEQRKEELLSRQRVQKKHTHSKKHRRRQENGEDAEADGQADKKKKRRNKKKGEKESGQRPPQWATEMTEDGVTLDDLLGSDKSEEEGGSETRSASGDDDDHQQQKNNNKKTVVGGKQQSKGPLSWLQMAGAEEEPVVKASPPAGPGIAYGQKTPAAEKSSDNSSDEENADSSVGADGEEDDGDLGVEGGSPLDDATAEAVCRLLCGSRAAAPPLSFLQQGFTFDDESLDYALTQWRRGPGAVMAVVQSLVITYLFEREVYMNVRTRQRDCLRRALSTILFRAQPNPASMVLVCGRLASSKPQRQFDARVRTPSRSPSAGFRVWTHFESAEEVEDVLSDFTARDGALWLDGKDCGLLCLLLSVCLSRGVETVVRDMAATGGTRTCLIDEATGDGTLELMHLFLTGRATPQPQPRGVAPQPSGLLDSSAPPEGVGSVPVALVAPGYPSWVVSHKGHYSNLFMRKDTRKTFRQKRELSGTASVELVYWDALTEDNEYELTVMVGDAGVGGKARVGSSAASAASFVTAAIQSVTDWRRASVDWNGEVPVK